MSNQSPPDSVQTGGAAAVLSKILAAAAVLSACGFGVVLGVRPLASVDLGYHLAYGEAFWTTGRLVDHNNDFIYTLDGYRHSKDRPDPGPGCWYDSQGRYRFPNANWLSQVILSGVYRLGGAHGLCLLRAALVAGTMLLILWTLRNLAVPWTWCAAAILLVGVASYGRYLLRPELFSYLILAAQLCILTQSAGKGPVERWKVSWPAAAGLIFLQLLMVNLHSYFLLSLALTGAVLADRALYLWWYRGQSPRCDQTVGVLQQAVLRLATVLGGQIVVCFVNPWTWRLAILPIQTLLYLRKHNITTSGLLGHPWAAVGEFLRPFAVKSALQTKATYAYFVLLGLSGLGALAAVMRRQWAWAAVVVGMTAVSLSMRRNIAPAAMLVTPLALAAVWAYGAALKDRLSVGARCLAGAGASVAILLAAGALILSVVTQHFYVSERSPARFRLGFDELRLPLGAAEWLNRHEPKGRLWTDFNSSSNLHYFTVPHRPMPIVTNTWAYPPDVMRYVLDAASGRLPFQAVAATYAPEIVVLRPDAGQMLINRLAADPAWAIVCVDWLTVVFLRADGRNAELAARSALTDGTFDVDGYILRIERLDPVPAESLFAGGARFHMLGWNSVAMRLFQRALEHDPKDARTLNSLGRCFAERGRSKFVAKDPACKNDFETAKRHFEHALAVDGDYEKARYNLRVVEADLLRYESVGPSWGPKTGDR